MRVFINDVEVDNYRTLGPSRGRPDIQQITVFSAAVHASAKNADGAKALIRFLTSPEAAPVVRRTGMEPG